MRIRLSRFGCKNRPFYRVMAADSRSPRDGKHLEVLGYYNPLPGSLSLYMSTFELVIQFLLFFLFPWKMVPREKNLPYRDFFIFKNASAKSIMYLKLRETNGYFAVDFCEELCVILGFLIQKTPILPQYSCFLAMVAE